jgi:hypothetical protein
VKAEFFFRSVSVDAIGQDYIKASASLTTDQARKAVVGLLGQMSQEQAYELIRVEFPELLEADE